MDFAQLKKLYPTAQLMDSNQTNGSIRAYPYKNKWVHIDATQLTEKEHALLSLFLTQAHEEQAYSTGSSWYAYLIGERKKAPYTTSSVRMIQLILEKKDKQFDSTLWIDSIQQLFEPVLDAFFYSEDLCLLIQNEEAFTYSREEMQGILQTLEEDFSLRTVSYVGQYWEPNEQLASLFNEEIHLFQKESSHLHTRMTSLSDVAIHYFTSDSIEKSPVMQELKQLIESHAEWEKLIHALWESQGNISTAAKTLFIHRNTLQYRMDKFHETTGLSLKDMNDLLLCYLLVV